MGVVYCATNAMNGKRYIGKTIKSLVVRQKQHEHDADKGRPWAFHRALRKYGFDAFEWKILFECGPNKMLIKMESRYITDLKTVVPAGYNIVESGSCGFAGRKHTEETKRKMSESAKITSGTEKFKQRVSEVHTGKVNSAETRKKMSEAQKGKARHTPESKAKLSAAGMGRKHTEEAKQKMSASQKARMFSPSPEVRAKIAATNKGQKRSAEARLNMSVAGKKRAQQNPMTDEMKKRISETMKAHFRSKTTTAPA